MIATENMFKPAYNISLIPSVVFCAFGVHPITKTRCIMQAVLTRACTRGKFYRVTGTHLRRGKNTLLHAHRKIFLKYIITIHKISRSVAKSNKEGAWSPIAEVLDANLHTMKRDEYSHEYSCAVISSRVHEQ